MQKKEISIFSVGTFFLTVPKNFVGGINQCFRIIKAWKFVCRRSRYHYFLLEIFFLTVPKYFVRGITQCFR